MFKEINKKEGPPARFGDVVSKLEQLPAWMNVNKMQSVDTSIVSLRPPRLPSGLMPESDETEAEVTPSSSAFEGVANDIYDGGDGEPNYAGEYPMSRASSEPAAGAVEEVVSSRESHVKSASSVNLESMPPPPKRLDTLFDELIPRADEEAVSAIRDAVAGMLASRQAVLRDSEASVIELARIVAERVIARELSLDPRVVTGLVREGLSALSAGDQVTVRLGSFFEEVKSDVIAAVARLGVQVDVEIDPSLGAYGCTIQTEWGRVDESIEQRLRNMLERLSVIPPQSPRGKI